MRMLTTSIILSALLGLSACEPKGPAADIGDNIDQVTENAIESAPAADIGDNIDQVLENTSTVDNTSAQKPAMAPEPEVIEAQKENLETATQVASEEAEERLNEIIEQTVNEP